MDCSCHFNFSSIVREQNHALTLLLRIIAPAAQNAAQRKPLNISLVLDRSGSMSSKNKLAYAKEAAKLVISHLKPQDRVSVVIYDGRVETLIEARNVTNKPELITAIERIKTQGSTNLSGGLLEGYRQLEIGQQPEALNRVLLLTDGLANQGVTDPEALRAIASQHCDRGLTLTTLGFGEDFDELILTQMADAGGGAFYFIENPDQAPATFQTELGELLSVVGQNLVIDITVQEPTQVLGVLNTYPTTSIPGGLRIHAGDVFGEEVREVLAEMLIPRLPELGECVVGQARITLDQVVPPMKRHDIELPLAINVVTPEQSQATPDPEVEQPALLLQISRLRDEIAACLRRGDYEAAQAVYRQARERMQKRGELPSDMTAELDHIGIELERYHDEPELTSKGMHYGSYRMSRSRGDFRRKRRPESGDPDSGDSSGS
jgi:Ca-activated chloride channel family protein